MEAVQYCDNGHTWEGEIVGECPKCGCGQVGILRWYEIETAMARERMQKRIDEYQAP